MLLHVGSRARAFPPAWCRAFHGVFEEINARLGAALRTVRHGPVGGVLEPKQGEMPREKITFVTKVPFRCENVGLSIEGYIFNSDNYTAESHANFYFSGNNLKDRIFMSLFPLFNVYLI